MHKNKRIRRLAIGMIVASAVTIGTTASNAGAADRSAASYSYSNSSSGYETMSSRGIRW